MLIEILFESLHLPFQSLATQITLNLTQYTLNDSGENCDETTVDIKTILFKQIQRESLTLSVLGTKTVMEFVIS